MTTALGRTGAACLLAVTGLLAGCASPGAPQASAPPTVAMPAPLATSMTAAGGTWAVVAMGGSAADNNRFWELFTRPAAGSRWELATPPGVADNGGLVTAGDAGTLTVAFRPSQGLAFSPLALTSDRGRTWDTGLIDAPVAPVPDALAVGARTMLALLADGAIDQAAGNGANRTQLAAPGAIAATAAGRRCEVTTLTAVAYTPSGTPLAAGACARAGIAGIFARTAGAWQLAGPVVPAGRLVRVLRLTGIAASVTALLQAGTDSTATLLAAWTSDGARWTASSPLSAGTGQVIASGTGPGGAVWVLLSGSRAETVPGPGASWRALPPVPRGTAALAAGPGSGAFDALTVSGGMLTVYRLTPAGAWGKTQVISVPIQYGSSG
jgi:hypothetical protein